MTSARRRVEPRMLTKQEAADYCGCGVASFLRRCPVVPTSMGGDGRLNRYDVRLLDVWIDSFVPSKDEADDDYWLQQAERAL